MNQVNFEKYDFKKLLKKLVNKKSYIYVLQTKTDTSNMKIIWK